jgi:hypothetical protein
MSFYGCLTIPGEFYNNDVIDFMQDKTDEIYVNETIEFVSYNGNINRFSEEFFQEHRIPYNIEMDEDADGPSIFKIYRPNKNLYIEIPYMERNQEKINKLLEKYPLQ